MNGCTPTDKPLLSILLSVYEPRRAWLREQLLSLEAQTWPNLRLYIRADGSGTITEEELRTLVRECVPSIPTEIEWGGENLGSTGSFERLTQHAEGEYFAYCDQDDVWLPRKLETLFKAIREHNAELVCSDVLVTDENGYQTAGSITEVRRHHVFRSGRGLAPGLLVHNFAIGCTMLVRADTARRAVPFCPYMVHDHYLALFCAERGAVVSLPDKLVRYRLHGDNQTTLLAGVTDKKSYFDVRIRHMAQRLSWLEKHFECSAVTRRALEEALVWANAREVNWEDGRGKKAVWQYRRFSPLPSAFELIAPALPESVFRACVAAGKRNWL